MDNDQAEVQAAAAAAVEQQQQAETGVAPPAAPDAAAAAENDSAAAAAEASGAAEETQQQNGAAAAGDAAALGDALPPPPPLDAAIAEPAPPADGAEPRRRRHTWGPPAKGTYPTLEELRQPKKKKRSRWDSDGDGAGGGDGGADAQQRQLALIPAGGGGAGGFVLPGQIPREVTLAGGMQVVVAGGSGLGAAGGSRDPKVLALRAELADIERRLSANILDIAPEGDPRRSPSPEPVYDKSGVRLNTRELRARAKLADRRHALVEELIKSDPGYRPPPDYKPRKITNKIYIPVNEYPGYNFIGLIIGPRGNTQKRMQAETNTRIAIRGKGSVKEGASTRAGAGGLGDNADDDELHVQVTGDSQADVS